MRILNVINFVIKHPLNSNKKLKALLRLIRWQVRKLSGRSVYFEIPFIDDSKLYLKKGQVVSVATYYVGLMEYENMVFLLKYLRMDDIFYDIGANVGTYSILAAKNVGCATVAFEPDEQNMSALRANIELNAITKKVVAVPKAVGRKNGMVKFISNRDATSKISESFEAGGNFDTIECCSLDSLNLPKPTVIKIDVEGFEAQVIKGAQQTLLNDRLNVIIVELRGNGNLNDESFVYKTLIANGFTSYRYVPSSQKIQRIDFEPGDLIFIRDSQLVKDRIKTAPTHTIRNISDATV